jgi:hypothetical protein
MQYSKFYFLHIPKTGGRFLKRKIIDPIRDILEKNGIEMVETNPRLWHHGWHENIDQNTYIFSCMREPVSWTVSYFTHLMYQENHALDVSPDNFHSQVILRNIDLDKSQIFDWLEREPYRDNYQSKNFLLNPALRYRVKMDQFFSNARAMGYVIDKNRLAERIDRVNLLVRMEDMRQFNYNNLLQKIFSDLNISSDYMIREELDRNHLSIDSSRLLYNTLNDSDKDKIGAVMDIDLDIYNTDKYFWRESPDKNQIG